MRSFQPQLRDLLTQTVSPENILPNLSVPNSTQTVHYNQILSYAKDLARHASQSEVETQNVIQKLKTMADEIKIIENYEQSGDKNVYEVLNQKVR